MRRVAPLLTIVALASCATQSRMQETDNLFRDYTGNVPGASVIVVRDHDVVFRKSYGLANLEDHIAATPDTHYRLASVTKQFTAAAILTLASEGKLSLDDPIKKWLPSLPAYADAMTIRQLLTHTSGLIDYEDVMPASTKTQLKDADVLRLLETQTTTYFAPGSKYQYSNTGFAFLALIVEKASGQRFADFLREQIFTPIGMPTTVAHEEGISTVRDRAFGYSRENGQWHRTDQSLTSAVLGDGGIYTSVDELVRWVEALNDGKFAEESVPRVDTDKAGMRYGFGQRISEHNGKRMISHTGESIGFRNAVIRFPDEKVSVIVLTNRNEGEPLAIAEKIADLLGPSAAPASPARAPR